MKSTLWIPCYNEWTQKVSVPAWINDVSLVERHTIYETLKILGPKMHQGLFSQVIITDDGSADDTQEGIIRFKAENHLDDDRIHIIWGSENVGKMWRFFEAFEFARKQWSDVFAMTDADMLSLGSWNVFERLTFSDTLFNRLHSDSDMYVSHQGEARASGGYFEVSGQETSGTRSLLISKVHARFSSLWINSNFSWKGYGLEILLNALLKSAHVNKPIDIEKIPLFCPPFRKGRQRQHSDIANTHQALVDRGFSPLNN